MRTVLLIAAATIPAALTWLVWWMQRRSRFPLPEDAMGVDGAVAGVPGFVFDVLPAYFFVFNGRGGIREGLQFAAFDVDGNGRSTRRDLSKRYALFAVKRPAFHDGLPRLANADVYDKGGWTIVITPSMTPRLFGTWRFPSPFVSERILDATIKAARQSPNTNDEAHILRPRHETLAERRTRTSPKDL